MRFQFSAGTPVLRSRKKEKVAARTRQRRRRAKGALRGAGARDGGRLSSEVGNEVSLGSARVAQRRADDHRLWADFTGDTMLQNAEREEKSCVALPRR